MRVKIIQSRLKIVQILQSHCIYSKKYGINVADVTNEYSKECYEAELEIGRDSNTQDSKSSIGLGLFKQHSRFKNGINVIGDNSSSKTKDTKGKDNDVRNDLTETNNVGATVSAGINENKA